MDALYSLLVLDFACKQTPLCFLPPTSLEVAHKALLSIPHAEYLRVMLKEAAEGSGEELSCLVKAFRQAGVEADDAASFFESDPSEFACYDPDRVRREFRRFLSADERFACLSAYQNVLLSAADFFFFLPFNPWRFANLFREKSDKPLTKEVELALSALESEVSRVMYEEEERKRAWYEGELDRFHALLLTSFSPQQRLVAFPEPHYRLRFLQAVPLAELPAWEIGAR